MSGQAHGADVDLAAVNGPIDSDGGVAHGARLVAFTDAVMAGDAAAIGIARARLREVLDDRAYVDCCAVIGSFNVVDRIADATGIPLDDMMRELSRPVREALDLGRFASSANTPGA